MKLTQFAPIAALIRMAGMVRMVRMVRIPHLPQTPLASPCTIAWLALLAWACALPPAAAQEVYPAKPVRIIVPFAAGGAGDVVTRIVAQRLTTRLGQPVVVENRPGAGGSAGLGVVARAAPDGYTLGFVSSGYALLPALYPNLPFNPVKDLTPVALLVSIPYVVLARKEAPFNTMAELVAYARTRPGTVSLASAGVGTLTHLLPMWFAAEAGITLNHIPFAGAGPSLNSVVGGQTDINFDPVSSSLPQLRAGKVKALAVTGDARVKAIADVPTLADLGFQARGSTWFGFLAPTGTPKPIVDRLNADINAVLNEDETKQRLLGMDFAIEAASVAKFATYLDAQIELWTRIIKTNNIKTEQ